MFRTFLIFMFATTPLFAEEQPQAVITTTVKEMCLNPCVSGVGTFTPYNDVMLKAQIDGKVESVEFREGENTKPDRILFKLVNIEQKANVKKAEAKLSLSKSKLNRKELIFKKGFLPPQELESIRAEVKEQEAEVTLAKEELEKTIIRAPFEGVLSERQVCKGAFVSEGDELVRLQDLDPIRLIFDVPQKDIPFIKEGDPINATTDVYPSKTFEGIVEAIEPAVNEKTRSVTVYATFANKQEKLLPGMYGNAKLKVSTNSSTTLYIPEQALVIRPDGVFVYKNVEKKAVLTPITIGQRLQDMAEILTGLQLNDEIVLDGQDKLNDGTPITIGQPS